MAQLGRPGRRTCRLEAERSFRDLKGTLRLRPGFHNKAERIRAHVLICFLALVIIRVAETRTDQTRRTLRAELGTIRQGHFRGHDGEFTQPTQPSVRQRQLLAQLSVPEPPRFGRITRLTQPVGTRAQAAQSPDSPLPVT